MERQSLIASGACYKGTKTMGEQLILFKRVVPLLNSSTRAQRSHLTTSQNFLQNRIGKPSGAGLYQPQAARLPVSRFLQKSYTPIAGAFLYLGPPQTTVHGPSIIRFGSEQPSERVIYNLINPILIIHHIVTMFDRGNNISTFPDVNRSEEEGSVKIPLIQTITRSLLDQRASSFFLQQFQ